MRVANCKTVCREIEEADDGQNLTASAREHLRGCGQCQRFHDERQKLRQLVASLETVAAPPDFELRVRSRLSNERDGAIGGFWFSNFTFRFPSFALATLVLVIGGVFALRVWNSPTTNTISVQTATPEARGPGSQREQPPLTGSGVRSNAGNQVLAVANHDSSEVNRRDLQLKTRSPLRSVFASSRNSRRLATREFSSTAAPVVKKEEAVASLQSAPIFLIEASSQPLRLSLDYSGGVSRTISVPALSFGSERVLTGDGLSLVKNSPKGAW
ncbi:MAG: hypothetical protein H0T77_07935 [Pyrinomonadaceae bacterium]|nr:hypothetical protein [Pyrinomonadaceae bacterium]